MMSQVSGECKLELKCFSAAECTRKSCGVLGCNEISSFLFYRPRERPGIHERKRKEGKEEREKQGRRRLRGRVVLLLLWAGTIGPAGDDGGGSML
jgi:hypothetical protein